MGAELACPLLQAEELAKLAEQRLKDFEAAKGLIRINGAGYGVLSARAKNKAAAKPARVPKKASGAGPLSARQSLHAAVGAVALSAGPACRCLLKIEQILGCLKSPTLGHRAKGMHRGI